MKPSLMKRIMSVRGLVISILVFALIFSAISFAMTHFGNKSSDSQLEIVRSAVKRAALTCYAVEGYYPQSEKYLKDNYGLAYDDDRYVVMYDAFASNLMPSIRVVERGADDE